MQAKQINTVNDLLIQAARTHNLQEVTSLLSKGANVNYVQYTNSDAWYSGNTSTPLYVAVHSQFKEEKVYLQVVKILLEKGANPNFKAVRGGWNHATQYPLFSNLTGIMRKFKDDQSKLQFIRMFLAKGVNINQVQRHGREKGHRGYDNQTCFLFEMMNQCKIYSKLNYLVQMHQQIDLNKLRSDKEKQLKQIFLKSRPKNTKQMPMEIHQQENNEDKQQVSQQQKPQNTEFIVQLIKLGVNPNAYTSRQSWQTRQFGYYPEYNQNQNEEEESLQKYEITFQNIYQSALHRAIMNNCVQLVKILVQKGADINKKCKYTINALAYPNQWPKVIKKKYAKMNADNLHQNQQRKHQILKSIEQTTDQQQKKSLNHDLEYYQFEIFKAQRYSIENQYPMEMNQVREITCLELAQLFKASKQILDILVSKIKK